MRMCPPPWFIPMSWTGRDFRFRARLILILTTLNKSLEDSGARSKAQSKRRRALGTVLWPKKQMKKHWLDKVLYHNLLPIVTKKDAFKQPDNSGQPWSMYTRNLFYHKPRGDFSNLMAPLVTKSHCQLVLCRHFFRIAGSLGVRVLSITIRNQFPENPEDVVDFDDLTSPLFAKRTLISRNWFDISSFPRSAWECTLDAPRPLT